MASIDPDFMVERKSIRRRLFLWRIFSFILLLAVVSIFFAKEKNFQNTYNSHIASIEIKGLITGNKEMVNLLRKIRESNNVSAVIMYIDSPGGTTVGAEILYDELRKLGKEKPLVAVMNTMATSGGYIAALGADYIVARGNTITGSIGVLLQWVRIDEGLKKLGIEVNTVKSGELKAEPDFIGPASIETIQVTQSLIDDSYEWFVKLVSERRKMNINKARNISDGRVYSGRQALNNGLIDILGGEEEAINWLVNIKGMSKELNVVEWDAHLYKDIKIIPRFASKVFSLFGIELKNYSIFQNRITKEGLDGLLSLWNPVN
jgi:protease IV